MQERSWVSKIIRFLTLYILPFILIGFVPFVEDAYDMGRFVLLTSITLIISLLWTIELIRTKSLIVSYNRSVIGFSLLTSTSLISIIVVSSNKVEALVHPLGFITWLCLTILCLIVPPNLEKKDRLILMWVLIAVSSLLGLLVIYQQFAITAMLFPTVSYLTNPLWNPTGSPVSAFYILILSVPIAIHLFKNSGTHHEDRNIAFSLIAILIGVIAGGIILWRYIPIMAPSILPFPVGWGILMESWKQPLGAIFGVGVDQFTGAFTLGKQLSINTTAIWNSAFNTNASLLLHIATVYGIFGVCSMFLFIFLLLQNKKDIVELQIVGILASISILFFPPSYPLVILLMFYCLLTSSEHNTHTYQFTSLGVVFGSIVCMAGILVSSIGWYRYVNGEILFYQGVRARNEENNGTKAYNLMILAMRQNPFISRYHATFGQLNLMLGGSIITAAKQDQTGKTATLTEEDKTLVTTLLSQAIREAKTATTLAPKNVYIWGSLASIYQNLIGVANDAPSWAIAAYQKAITLDPVNPVLRLDLGGVYMGITDYDSALREFTTAVTLKPNYANGYYNLANVLRIKGNTKEAKAALQNVLELLPSTSTEYQKVIDEIKAFDTPSAPSQETPTEPAIIPNLTLPE